MKATVHVTLKNGVLDPQGQAIHHAAETLGYQTLVGIRQGKFFEVTVQPDSDFEKAHAEIEKLAREVLSNPVIEDYSVTFDRDASTSADADDDEGGHA